MEFSEQEITILCAQALGYTPAGTYDHAGLFVRDEATGQHFLFGPLRDGSGDAQCMALMKKFRLVIDTYSGGDWQARCLSSLRLDLLGHARDADLNRAICLCIARMQQEKEKSHG